jgi:hypothetical protein
VENHLEEQQETGGEKNKDKKQRNCLCLYLLFFNQVLHQNQNCEAPHRKQNTRLGQKSQNPTKKSKHIHLILSFFFPLRAGGEQEKTHQEKNTSRAERWADVRAPKTNKEALRNEK